MALSGLISKIIVGGLIAILMATLLNTFVASMVQSYDVPGWTNYTFTNDTEIQNMTESMKNTILEDTTQEVGLVGDTLQLLRGAEYAIRLPLTTLTTSTTLISDFFKVWPFYYLLPYITIVTAIVGAMIILAVIAILLRYAHI